MGIHGVAARRNAEMHERLLAEGRAIMKLVIKTRLWREAADAAGRQGISTSRFIENAVAESLSRVNGNDTHRNGHLASSLFSRIFRR